MTATSVKTAEELRDEKFHDMTTLPVGGLISRMAVPSVVSMMVSAFYNLADTWFISQVGEKATNAVAAVGVIFSYQLIVASIGFYFGHGSGNYISRALGRRERKKASVMAATGAFSSFLAGSIAGAVALVIPVQLLMGLGAAPVILTEACEYLQFIAISAPFYSMQLTLNNQLRLQGNARLGMVGIASGAVLNVILDAVLIMGFGLGITGASIATAVSQVVGCVVLFAMTHVGDGLPPRLANFRPSLRIYGEIMAGGLPSLSRQGLNAIAAVVLNRHVVVYGADPLAALSIVNRLVHMILCVAIGVGQGFQPVCGFNYGARLFDRVRSAFFFGVRVNTAILVCGFVAIMAFAPQVIALFGSSARTAEIACRAIRYYSLALPFLGFVVMTEMFYQNTRQTVKASLLAMMRQGIALMPAVIVLDRCFGLEGVLWAQPVANFVSLCVAAPFAVQLLRQLAKSDERRSTE